MGLFVSKCKSFSKKLTCPTPWYAHVQQEPNDFEKKSSLKWNLYFLLKFLVLSGGLLSRKYLNDQIQSLRNVEKVLEILLNASI